MTQGQVSAFAPASIGNVSVGFDLLGAALAPIDGSRLGDEVSAKPAATFNLTISGRFADRLPGEASNNIVAKAYDYFHQRAVDAGHTFASCALHLHKNLPIGSGLGSSASSIVAALAALNAFYGEPFSQNELLQMMGALEGQISGSVHYDNVAPAYLGGLTLMVEHGQTIASQLPVFADWYWVVCYSGISVSTSAARQILPAEFPMKTLLAFGRQLSVFVDACHRGDENLAAAMLSDVVAEPYRKSLLPHFDQCRDYILANNGLAFGISGSGPTVFAVAKSLADAEDFQRYLQQYYLQNDDGFCHICKLDPAGTRISKETL